MRADMEQDDRRPATPAKTSTRANEAAAKGYLLSAKEYYEAGLAKWRELLDRKEFSFLLHEGNTMDDTERDHRTYRQLLEKRDEPFPNPFILQDVIDAGDGAQGRRREPACQSFSSFSRRIFAMCSLYSPDRVRGGIQFS